MSKLQKILLVEDDNFIAELYERALKKAGYDVTAVIKGTDGLHEAASGNYDLVLLDIMIPDLTGVEVLNTLRGENGDKLPNTKVVIATNLDQDDESRAAVEAKADGYIIKADMTPRRLVEFIKTMEQV